MNTPAKTDTASAPAPRGPVRRLLGWAIGWIVLPAAFFAALFAGGVALGVHLPGSWWTRFVLWCANLLA